MPNLIFEKKVILIICLFCLTLVLFRALEEVQTSPASEKRDPWGSFEALRLALLQAIEHIDNKGKMVKEP